MKQSKALAVLKSGRNVFLTGSAGSGKTYVLNKYIRYLRDHDIYVAVTASTGIAATHMNGMTIHSWSGIGVRDEITDSNLASLMEKNYFRKKMERVKVLIIDEISMLHRRQIGLVDQVLRYCKEPFKPFGGVQVVFSGDFFQLPPVGSGDETSRDKFAFMSEVWLQANLTICYLTEQHRQSENALTTILNEVRSGEVGRESIQSLQSRVVFDADDSETTKLFTHNADVDRINTDFLNRISQPAKSFTATHQGHGRLVDMLKKSVLALEILNLKVGARVMFIRNNIEKRYVNGTVGIVIDFNEDDIPIVKTRDREEIVAEPETWAIENEMGQTLASISQVPLRLAWAITIHKSQGMTLDSAVIDLNRAFERGQGYVALSRLRDLESMKLYGFNRTALEVDSLAAKADVRFRALSEEADVALAESELAKSFNAFIVECGGIIEKYTHPNRWKNFGKKKKPVDFDTYKETRELLEQKLSIDEIAEKRGLRKGTILLHLVHIAKKDPVIDIEQYRPSPEMLEKVKHAAELQPENEKLSVGKIYNDLHQEIGYDEIRLSLMFIDKS